MGLEVVECEIMWGVKFVICLVEFVIGGCGVGICDFGNVVREGILVCGF